MTGEGQPPWYYWPHCLGVDAAILAVAWQAIAARSLGTEASRATQAALFLTVAGIYACDRAWDASRAPRSQHWRHVIPRRWIWAFLVAGITCLVASAATALVWMPRESQGAGLLVGLLCAAYYASKSWTESQVSPEMRALFLGGIFALGLWAPMAALSESSPHAVSLLLAMWAMLSANALQCLSSQVAKTGLAWLALFGGLTFGLATTDFATGSLLALGSAVMLGLAGRTRTPTSRAALADALLMAVGIVGWCAVSLCDKIG